MSIKIYSVMGVGLIVGEKIRQENEKVYLEYPGVVVPNQQTPQGIQTLMVPPVPGFFAGQFELLKEFPLKKNHIIISGLPSQDILDLYSDYSKKVREAATGIVEVGADAMDHLPKNGKGEPIL